MSISEAAKAITSNLLPEKSKEKYIQVYNKFVQWKQEKQVNENDFSEDLLLVYFDQLKNDYASSSLWCFYSLLRTSIQRNHNVDIGYPKVITLLKMAKVGFQAKKSNVFQPSEIRKFLSEASDIDHLATKVIMIMGIYGATRADELTRMDLADIKKEGTVYVVKIPVTKTHIVRTFTVENEYAEYLTKYLHLRLPITTSTRLFMNYQKGKCTNQPIGRNKFLGLPKVIAKFLNLPDAHKYTGHSFRRTSATLLADAGADILTLKRHGGWKSSSSVDGYVEDSISSKRRIGNLIAEQVNLQSPTSSSSSSPTTLSSTTSLFDPIESVICSQIVSVTRSTSLQEAVTQNQLSVSPTTEHQRMQFNNCNVTINFTK